jgi:hypothetical protein
VLGFGGYTCPSVDKGWRRIRSNCSIWDHHGLRTEPLLFFWSTVRLCLQGPAGRRLTTMTETGFLASPPSGTFQLGILTTQLPVLSTSSVAVTRHFR